jgi:hypothetical protein
VRFDLLFRYGFQDLGFTKGKQMANDTWQAWVWVKWKPGTPANAWESWKTNPVIKGAWSTLGEWDCCLWVDATGPDALEEFVWKTIRKNEWVESTNTNFTKKWW